MLANDQQPQGQRTFRRRSAVAIRVVLLAGFGPFIASAVNGQTAEPPKAWTTCAACHAVEGTAAIGPTLDGVVGRRAGSVPGFDYSRAMKNANITWDETSLTAFLSDPQKAVPGTRMFFAGVADSSDLVELLRYLKTLQ